MDIYAYVHLHVTHCLTFPPLKLCWDNIIKIITINAKTGTFTTSTNDFVIHHHPVICLPYQIKKVLNRQLKLLLCIITYSQYSVTGEDTHTQTSVHTHYHHGAAGRPTTIICNKIEKDRAGRKVYINKLVTAGGVPLTLPVCSQAAITRCIKHTLHPYTLSIYSAIQPERLV